MTEELALEVGYQAIRAMVLMSAPIMLVGLVIGLAIAIFQALTQIQEATLTFVPRILVVFLSLLVLTPFMLQVIKDLMVYVADVAISIQ